jgi:hypothetical protein
VRIRKPEYEALCTFDLCIGIAAKSQHVYGTLASSCLLERPWWTGERALLSRAVRTALVWRRPNHDRLGGGTPCASDADDSKN